MKTNFFRVVRAPPTMRMHPLGITRSAVCALALAALSTVTQAAEKHQIHAIFKSTDRGRSWSRSDTGMPCNSRINAFGSLDESIFAGTDSGIFISRDAGQSWQPSTGAGTTSGRALCFATLGKNVYAGTDCSGILVSPDKGTTWSINSSFPLGNVGKVRCLLGHQGKLYAGTDAEGVLVSGGNGRSWTRFSQGLPAHAQIFAMAAVDGKLFVALYSKGLYRWSDQDQNWAKVGHVSPLVLAVVGDTVIAGHNPGGIYWSRDSGATWSHATANSSANPALVLPGESAEFSNDAPLWELASNDGIVFAGAADGIYFSEDRGRTWVSSRAGLPPGTTSVSFLVKANLVLAGALIAGAGAQHSP